MSLLGGTGIEGWGLSLGASSRTTKLAAITAITCLAGALLVSAPTTANAGVPACTTTWTAASGEWDSGGWSNGIPGAGSVACVTGAGANVKVIGNPSHQQPRVNQAGTLIIGPGATVEIEGGGGGCVYGVSLLSVANDVHNEGKILFTNWNSCSARLAVGGTLTNQTAGVIHVSNDGADGWIRGDVINQGLIDIDNHFKFDDPGAVFVNSTGGTIDIQSGQLLTIESSDGSSTHAFIQAGGSVAAPGSVSAPGFRMNKGTFNFGGGSTTGDPLQLASVALNPSINAGTGSVEFVGGGNTLAGDVTANKTVIIRGGGAGCTYGDTTVTSSTSRTNSGTIKFTSDNNCDANLTFTTGTLTNAAAGTIHVVNTGGGTFKGNLDNQGLIDIDNPITLNKPGATYTNTGTIDITSDKTLTIAASDDSETHTFTLAGGTLSAPGTQGSPGFRQNGGNFAVTGGTATGELALVGPDISVPSGTGTFELRGNANELKSNVGENIALEINGGGPGGTFGNGKLTSADSFTNHGTIRTTHNNSAPAALEVQSGTLTNSPTGEIEGGAGGSNTFTTNLDNQGLLDAASSSFNKASGAYSSSGTIVVAEGATLTFNNPLTQTAGTTRLAGNNSTIDPTTYQLQGGTLEGTGQVSSPLNNDGIVKPGLSPGAITVVGDYVQTSGGVYEVEITGTGANQFDRLNVTGSATLAGTLKMDSAAYQPTVGQSISVLNAASVTGAFGTLQGLLSSGARPWKVTYGQNDVFLTARARSDLAVEKSAPDSVEVGDVVTYQVAATNSGPDAAEAVTITDTLPGRVALVSVKASAGGTCADVTPPTVSCQFAEIANGGTATMTVKVRTTRIGSLVNNAKVLSTSFNPPAGNKDSAQTDVVRDAAGCEIVGTAGPDVITGTDSADVICAGGGGDTVNGGPGADDIRGGGGGDTLKGDAGGDEITGGDGSDDLFGNDGADDLRAKDATGGETVNGGPGNDTCTHDPKDNVSSC